MTRRRELELIANLDELCGSCSHALREHEQGEACDCGRCRLFVSTGGK